MVRALIAHIAMLLIILGSPKLITGCASAALASSDGKVVDGENAKKAIERTLGDGDDNDDGDNNGGNNKYVLIRDEAHHDCLTAANREGDMLSMTPCDASSRYQLWSRITTTTTGGKQFGSSVQYSPRSDRSLCMAMGLRLKACKSKRDEGYEKQLWTYSRTKRYMVNLHSNRCVDSRDMVLVESCSEASRWEFVESEPGTGTGTGGGKTTISDKYPPAEPAHVYKAEKVHISMKDDEKKVCVGIKGKRLAVRTCDGNDLTQCWNLIHRNNSNKPGEDDYFATIRPCKDDALCAQVSRGMEGVKFKLKSCVDDVGGKKQKFHLSDGSRGTIRPKMNLDLCAEAETYENEEPIWLKACSGIGRQTWRLRKFGTISSQQDDGDDDDGSKYAKQAARLSACEGQLYDAEFPESVALSDDTIVFGSYAREERVSEDGGEYTGKNAGAVCVYARSGSTWKRTAKLTASDGEPDSEFGASVSLRGDTLVVGAPGDKTRNGERSGSAYIFVRSGSTWKEQDKIVASDGEEDDNFGRSTSIDGDTIVVSRHIFTRSGSKWKETKELEGGTRRSAGAIYGDTIVMGDSNHDWTDDDDDTHHDAGRILTYERTSSSWTRKGKIDPRLKEDAYFGHEVAIHGDTIITNAPGMDLAFVVIRSGSTWGNPTNLYPVSSDKRGHDFGSSVAIYDSTIVVGASGAQTVNGHSSGKVDVFVRSGSKWKHRAKLIANEGRKYDAFGTSVAIYKNTIVVGAPSTVVNGKIKDGAAYVFVIKK